MEVEELTKEIENDEGAPPNKKPRLWSAKEFRKKLKTAQKVLAIQEFLINCREDGSYVIEYLESGGSCMELIQLLSSNEIPTPNILEILNYVLLQIVTGESNLDNSANNSCKLFVQSHLSSINKMLALGSPRKDKKVILKLLTTIVTFSKSLAKEILLHININPSNVEVLAKRGDDEDSVRNAYIRFLMSFLVEGETATILIFLEKRILLSSIFKGLQYDSAETIVLVLSTLKRFVLENGGVMKTTKMSLFSTLVVREIVSLYNWKGMQAAQTGFDPVKKAMVSECVHDFLLVLCTSHKYGVIFKDPYIGSRPKTYNSLMHTVLDSLERPWEHSYAGELVRKICGACPDLVKSVWSNLRNFLEPRHTDRWLNTVKFAVSLMKEVQPTTVELSTETLSVQQICQIIPSLVAPTSILQIILPKNTTFEKPVVKYNIIAFLSESLRSFANYVNALERSLNQQQFYILKISINEYISKHFLNVDQVISNWTKVDDEPYSVEDNVEAVLDLLNLYEANSPPLLEGLANTNLKSLLDELDTLSKGERFKVRLVNLFLKYEPSIFTPSSEIFPTVFSLILQHYHETGDENAYTTLIVLLNNSAIFEDATEEPEVWINTVLYFANVGEISGMLVDVIRETSRGVMDYIGELREFAKFEYAAKQEQILEILDGLQHDSYQSNESVRSTGLSPMLLGALKYLGQNRQFKHYLNAVLVNLLHLQTSSRMIAAIVQDEKYADLVSESLQTYICEWTKGEASALVKTKLSTAQSFSALFVNGEVAELSCERRWELRHCLNQALFYFTHLNCDLLNEAHLQSCIGVIKKVNEFGYVFKHPTLLQRFSPTTRSVTNQLIVEMAKLSPTNLDSLLKPFRAKLSHALCKVLKKRKKWHDITDILEPVGLDRAQCVAVLSICVNLERSTSDDFLAFHFKALVYTFGKFLGESDNLHPLTKEVIANMSELLASLNLDGFEASACTSLLHNYLRKFPHNLADIKVSLFESILLKADLHKEDVVLAGLLLSRRRDLLDTFQAHFEKILKQKSLLLVLLKSAISVDASADVLGPMYTHLEPSITKILAKSKKVSHHFEAHKDTIVTLIARFMSSETCRSHAGKVCKLEVTQPYHIHILAAIFQKILPEASQDEAHNILLTIASLTNALFKHKDKSNEDWSKLDEVARVSVHLLNELSNRKVSFRRVCEDGAFNLYCGLCLKFGLLGRANFLEVMNVLVRFLDLTKDEAQTILEMTGSHSEFLEVILGDSSECKRQLLSFMLELFKRWPGLMHRSHVPVLLSAYHGTVGAADQINLSLIQMYESEAQQTGFYDFKPFLWGKAAAAHYSVRQDIQWTLWRQPRMHAILEILEEWKINNTILNHPLDLTLTDPINTPNDKVYSLAFFLPLFASLLAPENQVSIQMFIKSGALSMTVLGLSCYSKEIRLASCHVLARFHYHLEARRSGKDRILRLGLIEALCRGVATLEDIKLNNFASIFWARMVLILTRPLHPMFLPLSRYLTAKATPDLSGIPELYTFLHVPDVNHKDPRFFILKILHDGMRTDHDCSVASYKMAFKLIMELFTSCVSDSETKLAILNVFESTSKLKLGQEILTTSYGMLSWLYDVINNHCEHPEILSAVLQILANLTRKLSNSKHIDYNIVKLISVTVIDFRLETISVKDLDNLLQVILAILDVSGNFLTLEQLRYLIRRSNDDSCNYLLEFGCEFSTVGEDKLIQILVRKCANKFLKS
ncbi:hypothetical protein PPYR_13709 [Photinus pyralis]|uniref:Nucleolar pre-ribosomal-associated protein 1 n=1 Tax=Photinus pyralis TaxID=7054 RepID=A0A5N4A9X9_PHOPY|nr:nucleolar pre-ribosomal-associated protein 1 [Photinus pyralis]KAB0794089.1 hypothetical protein PPYR_13709 [Photinus pyralis]